MNYIRCEDLPIVFHQLLKPDGQVIQNISSYCSDLSVHTSNELLSFGGTDTLTVPFQPEKLVMFPDSGRVYHIGPVDPGVGLIKSSLAIELSRFFVYDKSASERDSPKEFYWKGTHYVLDNTVLKDLSVLK